MAHPLIERLTAGIVLGDGAMGTMLFDAGHTADECLESLNATHPETVASVHRQYINAGAELIETNTFGGNRYRLATHGLQDRVRDVNKRGVRIAREEREISGTSVIVAGSIGPTGRTIEPFGTLSREDATAGFREQIEFLLEAGVDLLVIETMGSLGEMDCAIDAARAASDLPIVAMMTFAEDGRTLSGRHPEEVVRELATRDIDVIGANCSVGPQRLLGVISRMNAEIERPPEGSAETVPCLHAECRLANHRWLSGGVSIVTGILRGLRTVGGQGGRTAHWWMLRHDPRTHCGDADRDRRNQCREFRP